MPRSCIQVCVVAAFTPYEGGPAAALAVLLAVGLRSFRRRVIG